MPEYQPIDYRLRCHTKRTDLPADVLRDIGEAYAEIERLHSELEDAKIQLANMEDDYFRIRRHDE
jgi:regulator of sirC expression with transglutaminase-like and TPR domain